MVNFKKGDIRDNKSSTKKRAISTGHNRPVGMLQAIIQEVKNNPGFDAMDKYNLANDLLSKYPDVPIGEINHEIERAIRTKNKQMEAQ